MLKALLKVNAAAFVNWLAGSGKRGNKGKSSKGKMIVYALLMLYALGVFCWLFGEIFALLAPPLYNAGCGWLYFVYVFIVAFALMFVFSVLRQNRLYEAKDNDLLLAMPIPPSVILASRMALLLAMNVLFGAIVVGPAIYRWYEIVPFSLGSLVCMIVEFLGLCLFSLALSALFGWLLSLVSSKMRKKRSLKRSCPSCSSVHISTVTASSTPSLQISLPTPRISQLPSAMPCRFIG